MTIELNRRVGELERKINRMTNTSSQNTAVSFALGLPGLVGFWVGTVDRGTPRLVDASNNGLELTRNGDAAVSNSSDTPLVAYTTYDGTGDYFSRADENKLDIRGDSNDAIIDSAIRGLTMMAWVYLNSSGSGERPIMSKWVSTGNQYSYRLSASGSTKFAVSGDGSTVAEANGTAASMPEDTWVFVAGRYIASTSVKVWTNLVTAENTTSIPASLHSGTAMFALGRDFHGGAEELMNGRIAYPILCASALSDTLIQGFYQQTRWLFRV